jgi:hypothetical protein
MWASSVLASVWHGADDPETGGRGLLDGVVNGICTQAGAVTAPATGQR